MYSKNINILSACSSYTKKADKNNAKCGLININVILLYVYIFFNLWVGRLNFKLMLELCVEFLQDDACNHDAAKLLIFTKRVNVTKSTQTWMQ